MAVDRFNVKFLGDWGLLCAQNIRRCVYQKPDEYDEHWLPFPADGDDVHCERKKMTYKITVKITVKYLVI